MITLNNNVISKARNVCHKKAGLLKAQHDAVGKIEDQKLTLCSGQILNILTTNGAHSSNIKRS